MAPAITITQGGHVFTRTSKADQAKALAVLGATAAAGQQLREKVAPVVAVKAHEAKDWASPYVERSVEAAGTGVEAAVEKVSPAVEAAREKFVEELLPRMMDAVQAAAATTVGVTAVTAASAAKSRGGGAVAVLKGEAIAKPVRRRRGRLSRLLLVLTALAAAGGAAFAAFRRQEPQNDPWSVPAETYPPASGSDTTTSTLASGEASDALGGEGNSISDPDVPGLTTDSAAAKDAIVTSAPADLTAKDPLTDPIDEVEQR